ncbi:hypothetical protein [Halomonas sp. WWR20]
MVTEPQRLQYLEAMGLAAWSSRYRLPNAALTPQCEWQEDATPATEPRGARLHALLDTASAPEASAVVVEPPATPRPALARARALLEEDAQPKAAPGAPRQEHTEPHPTASQEPASQVQAEPLRFTLQVAALQGRWLVLASEEQGIGATEQQLLINLLRAAGIVVAEAPSFETFRWPLMKGMTTAAPLEEARDGVRAFIAGQARRGWRPERLLVFGHDDVLTPLLQVENAECRTLALPCWQAPSLTTLANSAEAKRSLWPVMSTWQTAWADTATATGADVGPDHGATDAS